MMKLETSNFSVSRPQRHGVKMFDTHIQWDLQTVCRGGVKISLNVSKVICFKSGVGKQLPAFL